MKPITILIVDDHSLLRKAWSFTLNQDSRFKVISESGSGESAVELTKKLNPDIVIIDINLPGMNGIEATQLIKKQVPDTKIIGLSFDVRPEYAQEMFQSGATGYFTKNISPEEIYIGIVEVNNHRQFICHEMKNALMEQLTSWDGYVSPNTPCLPE